MSLPGTVNVQKTLEAAQQLRLKKNDSQTEIIKDAVTQALTEDREKNPDVPTKPKNYMENTNFTDEEKQLIFEMKEYTSRMLRALAAIECGEKPILEAYNEIFLEASKDEKTIISKIARMIQHLLKFAYCSSDISLKNNTNRWTEDFEEPKEEVIELLGWPDDLDTNLVKFTKENLQRSYKRGKGFYKNDTMKYSNLVDGLKIMPIDLPSEWTLENLLNLSISQLVSKLPNVKNQI